MTVETHELAFEDDLIHFLTRIGGTKQWEYLPNIKTTEQLWANFRHILEVNNPDKLDQPLSKTEFAQVKREIRGLKTPYQAGQFLYGLNGKSEIELDLDDGRHVFLTVFDQDQIGAGNTVYQVVNQIERAPVLAGRKNRRFDNTLLINGLPIIQIEEKADGNKQGAKHALNQMKQYISEQQYTGIFATLQILVGMTPHEIRYMANTTEQQFNTDFAFRWQREKDNTPVLSWQEFSNSVLSIPMAHQMATNYMILDGTPHKQMIKVMRPYQVYATRRIMDKLRVHQFGVNDKEIGYVWHTTGSGKTISSFKAAWLASRLPNVDKVVFLVDRIALTNQTYEEYSAYDPNTDPEDDKGGIVENTANKRALLSKLRKKGNGIIVTSIQKMDGLVCQHQGPYKSFERRVVFIVDEAHRSTSGDMLQRIKKAFKKSAWIGYTGTPRFDENEGPTTREIFGNLIHAYTIRDAIADKNVLGFKVDFETTLTNETLRKQYLPRYFKFRYPNWTSEQIEHRIDNITPEDMDDAIVPSVYDMNKKHVELVVKDVFSKWSKRSSGYRYNALFTTHVGGGKASTPMAMMYYREFLAQNKEQEKPLKIAVTFSQSTNNGDNQLQANKDLREAVNNYNQMFNTTFDDTEMGEYTQDVVSRLSRTVDDGKYLDLVIVIDQLLTGFNAPELNTLYVDRTLQGASLIQAYSRTNRVVDMQNKPWGRIVNYRWPKQTEKLMKEALAVYANPDSANVQTELNLANDGTILAKDFDDLKDDLSKTVSTIDDLTNQFEGVPKSENSQDELYSQLQTYNRTMAKIKQDDEYDNEHPEKLLQAVGMTPDHEELLTTTFANELKENIAKKQHLNVSDLDLRMEHVKDIKVNYDYLEELIAQLANQVHENKMEEAAKTRDTADRIADQIPDERYRQQVKHFSQDLYEGNTDVTTYPVQTQDVKQLILDHNNNRKRMQILAFKKRWGLVDIPSTKQINDLFLHHTIGADDLNQTGELNNIIHEAQGYYATDAEDPKVRTLHKLKYRNHLRQAFAEFADQLKQNF
ncbi:MAG: HsdR family type I site-specific deoxyribonuclease [Lentilactobacillus hilgardii]|uniref:type I restriction endonuclease subunit R n=1 Tax=Lentilactobacillus hilgardii TaxID=1588 RepID=UPI0039EC481B